MSENSSISRFTAFLSDKLCGGSHRKLIAGWWYTILILSLILTVMSLWVVSTRSSGEGFSSTWGALLLILLSIGGTMVMRKFHTSIAVGFFMGAVVATSQLFFMLFLVYFGYGADRITSGMNANEERVMATCSLLQSILLASFAAILGAHQSEILDRSSSLVHNQFSGDASVGSRSSYVPPTF